MFLNTLFLILALPAKRDQSAPIGSFAGFGILLRALNSVLTEYIAHMRHFFLLTLALAPLSGAAAEPVSVESIAAGYFSSDSYCDAGKRGWRDDPAKPYTQVLAFERCARRDGRFKYVEKDERTGASAKWSDAKKYYRYLEYGRRYQELSFDDPYLLGLYRDRSQIFPVFVFELFSADPRHLVDSAERARYLQSYTASSALSTPQYSVFERSEAHANGGERLWVLNASKSIVRHERLSGGDVVRFVEITSREVNRPLADADLRYDAPLLARYSLSNDPMVFIVGLHIAAGVAGALVWGWLLARTRTVEDVLRKRGRLWRLMLRFFGGIAIVLAVLAALTPEGGGHPPAIAYVWAMGTWCAVAFGMTACFLLASYPLQLLFRAARSGAFRNS